MKVGRRISMLALNSNINADLIMSGAFTRIRRSDGINALGLLGGSSTDDGAYFILNGMTTPDGSATLYTANTAKTTAIPCMTFGAGDTGLKQLQIWGNLFIDSAGTLQANHIAESSVGHNIVCDDIVNLATNRIVNVADPAAAQDAATRNYVDTAVLSLPAGSTSPTIYDAIILQSGTYTYAYDKDGNLLSSTLIASHTDDIPIQAALDYASTTQTTSGSVFCQDPITQYYIDTQVIVNPNAALIFSNNATVRPHAEGTNMFRMKSGSKLKGARIDCQLFSAYSGACITIEGEDEIAAGDEFDDGCQLEDLWLIAERGTGTAINLTSTDATNGCIFGLVVNNVRIYWFEYGIRMYRSGAANVNWINGNTFSNIWFNKTTHAIHQSSSIAAGQDLDGNRFVNIDFQSLTSTPWHSVPVIVLKGQYNSFHNLFIWDWDASWGESVLFDTNSSKNYVGFQSVGSANLIVHNDGLQTNKTNIQNTGVETVTLTAGTGEIHHGLGLIPTWALCTSSVTHNIVAVTALDVTHITIHVFTDAGADGTTPQAIYWQCGV